jgi:DNA-directed RNA polymerase beta subunit
MTNTPLTPVMVDSFTRRAEIRRKAIEGLMQSFPLKARSYTVELSNPRVEAQEFSSREQKAALLEGRSLNERVRGDLLVRDAQGNVTSDAKGFTLLHLPYFTPRHTFIVDGTEYSVSNQIRTKPGVYTRRRGNEDLEAAFNLSKGGNFRVLMEPEKGHLFVQPTHATTRIPLYPVLRALGVPHQDIAGHWGSEVASLNRDAFKNPEKHVDKFYTNFIHPAQQTHTTLDEKIRALHGYLDATAMDPRVNQVTLGHGYDKASPQAILTASKKLLDVHRAADDTDDRDSLAFKTFHSVDDFIKERLALDARSQRMKLGIKLEAHKGDIRKALPSAPFTRTVNSFLTGSSLSAVPTQINPMELIDHAVRVTSLGEGAISSERAIPLEARNLHATHFGIMDPVRTPESFKAGIDIRAALSTRRDAQGNLYSTLRNVKSGRIEQVKAEDIMRSVVAFPHEDVRPGKIVDALANGHVQRVPASQVTHQVVHVSDLYGPTTNLLPFLDGMQGNRSLMASKHQSQALSLIHREPPLVQVQSWKPGSSVEQEMTKLIVPTSPVAGIVSHIDGDYIHITPDQNKHGSAAFPEGYATSTRYDDEHSGGTVVDVHHGGKNVAWLSYRPKGDHTHIESMYVAPDHRGKGLAHSLLKETIAANPGELRLRARPFKDESASTDDLKKLYQQHGFVSSDNEGRMTRHKTAADDEFYSDFMKLGDNNTIKLHYDQHFPLAAKTYLHNDLKVKAGDRVHAGQPLATSNFTKDDTLALGTNLSVAYMPYRGLNTNDGIVVSEGAARRLVSEHMYKHVMILTGGVETKREKHRAYFGNKYTAKQYENLDEDGVVRPGAVVQSHDPLIVAVRPNQATGNAVLLGRLSKSLVKPFSEEVERWDHDRPGTVIDVAKTGDRITVTVKTEEHLHIGDKLSGRYGNKGVIAKIVPDHQMVQDAKGQPIDLLFTSAGIISRINPAQIIEASLGKVAAHTGKPIAVENFAPHDNVQYAKNMLKKHGLSDKETVFDPVTNRSVPEVFVGKSYILKLFKTTDSNWSSHGADRYDFNQQPARGGDDGAKAIGKMEFDGLVAHNARNVLKEAASLKSQKNDEFWRAIQLGLPTPAPAAPFAYNKFLTMLEGAGVKVSKQGSRLSLGPLTDNDIVKMSAGALKEPHKMIRAKDLFPETGGLFDPATTGGMSGTKWSHVDLHEPLVNPVFEEPVRRLLGLTQKEFTELHSKHGGTWFKQELGRIDVDGRLKDLRDRSRTLKGAPLDDVVKQIKYLNALQAHKLSPDLAYVLTKVPVTPPVIRPILPLKDGRLQIGDANLLYRDAFLANQKLHEVKGVLPSNELRVPRQHLYDAVSAVFGIGDPVSPTTEKREAKGYLAMITGTRPGSGFFQGKLMKRQQDISGRATIAPDPTLSMDEIGVPEDMLWGMFGKFVIGRLVKRGYPALDAQKMVEDKTSLARQELLIEAKERPVMVNRAPSLHRFNIIGAFPRITTGKTLMLNPFAERGTNADYDGDAMQIHAPVTQAAVEDVKRMTLSHLLFNDRRPGQLNVAPDMEAIIGLHRATGTKSDKSTKHFGSKEEALSAYHRGEINLADTIEIAK